MTAQIVPEGGIDRIPPFDPVTAEHFWVVQLTFGVRDPHRYYDYRTAGPMIFDLENLVLTGVVICWHCERLFVDVHHQPCPGDP